MHIDAGPLGVPSTTAPRTWGTPDLGFVVPGLVAVRRKLQAIARGFRSAWNGLKALQHLDIAVYEDGTVSMLHVATGSKAAFMANGNVHFYAARNFAAYKGRYFLVESPQKDAEP